MMRVGGAALDPYFYTNDGIHIENTNVSGRTQVDPRLVTSERTLVFLVLGQSLAANYVYGTSNLYTPSGKVENLLFTNGALYQAADPMLGSDNVLGSWLGRLGDKLIDGDVCDRVVFVPMGVGDAVVALFATGSLKHHAVAGLRRAAAVNLPVSAVLWQQGETDNVDGTSQSDYASRLNLVISNARGAGFNAPWLLAKSTWAAGTPSVTIRAAIDDVVNGTDILAGPDSDTLDNTYRNTDHTHLVASGANALADLWKTAIVAASLSPLLV